MFMSKNSLRAGLFIVAFAGIFISVWITLIASAILALLFPAWEVLFLGLFIDFLWLPSGSPLAHMPLATIAAIIAVWAFDPLRQDFLFG